MTRCESGHFTNASANTECHSCPPGTHAESGASRCTACAAASCEAGTCDQGTYSYRSASAACLTCPFPLVTTHAAATHCDGCVAGYFWSDDAHAAFLETHSHGDGAQCSTCCQACTDGMACEKGGHTTETIVVEEGYWRGSCARRARGAHHSSAR